MFVIVEKPLNIVTIMFFLHAYVIVRKIEALNNFYKKLEFVPGKVASLFPKLFRQGDMEFANFRQTSKNSPIKIQDK